MVFLTSSSFTVSPTRTGMLQSTSVTGIAVRCRVPRCRNFRSGTRNGNDAVQCLGREWGRRTKMNRMKRKREGDGVPATAAAAAWPPDVGRRRGRWGRAARPPHINRRRRVLSPSAGSGSAEVERRGVSGSQEAASIRRRRRWDWERLRLMMMSSLSSLTRERQIMAAKMF